jgi:hypothetical protein
MSLNYRLATFMLAGGYCGIAAISMIYVSHSDRFGFSVSQYQIWCAVGLIAGLCIGLECELLVRVAQRRGWRFSVRELMIAMAIVAVAIVACGSLAKWANAPNRGTSDAGIGIHGQHGRQRF